MKYIDVGLHTNTFALQFISMIPATCQVAETLSPGSYCLDFEGLVPDGRTVPEFPVQLATDQIGSCLCCLHFPHAFLGIPPAYMALCTKICQTP